MKEVELSVGGMTCGHCVASVKKVIDSTDGVAYSEVNLPDVAKIVFEESEVSVQTIIQNINQTESYTVNQ
jgi:Cu+-exporting ATPase